MQTKIQDVQLNQPEEKDDDMEKAYMIIRSGWYVQKILIKVL